MKMQLCISATCGDRSHVLKVAVESHPATLADYQRLLDELSTLLRADARLADDVIVQWIYYEYIER